MRYLFLSLRPKHWVKNLFIFLPLFFGKKLFIFPVNLNSAFAFLIFSVASSASYLVNDVIDYKEDKLHPVEFQRPIASGKVTKKLALLTAGLLAVISVILAFILNVSFGWIVTIYLLFNFIYTKFLKKVVIIDVFCIGVFFLLRIIAGGVVAKVELSHWIIIMTVLLALFLGFYKRRQELKSVGENKKLYRSILTKYSIYFIDQMVAVIISSIVVVYILYTVDTKTVDFFGTKNLIYSIPFVYYGIFRYLYLIHKVNKNGDPTDILFSDKRLQLDLILWIIVCGIVIYL